MGIFLFHLVEKGTEIFKVINLAVIFLTVMGDGSGRGLDEMRGVESQ